MDGKILKWQVNGANIKADGILIDLSAENDVQKFEFPSGVCSLD